MTGFHNNLRAAFICLQVDLSHQVPGADFLLNLSSHHLDGSGKLHLLPGCSFHLCFNRIRYNFQLGGCVLLYIRYLYGYFLHAPHDNCSLSFELYNLVRDPEALPLLFRPLRLNGIHHGLNTAHGSMQYKSGYLCIGCNGPNPVPGLNPWHGIRYNFSRAVCLPSNQIINGPCQLSKVSAPHAISQEIPFHHISVVARSHYRSDIAFLLPYLDTINPINKVILICDRLVVFQILRRLPSGLRKQVIPRIQRFRWVDARVL